MLIQGEVECIYVPLRNLRENCYSNFYVFNTLFLIKMQAKEYDKIRELKPKVGYDLFLFKFVNYE